MTFPARWALVPWVAVPAGFMQCPLRTSIQSGITTTMATQGLCVRESGNFQVSCRYAFEPKTGLHRQSASTLCGSHLL